MLRNYLKIAWRNLRKQAGFAFINIFGLATGLACCLLITLYMVDELSYDRFNEKADRIYRINADIKFGGNDMRMAVSPDPLGPTLKQDYPQVENFVRIHDRGTWLVKTANAAMNLREQPVYFADSTLFDVFTLPLVAGDPKRALAQPNSVVISESAALRHFGNQKALGQTLIFDKTKTFKVTGIMRDMPANSHFRTDFFVSMLNDDYQWGSWLSNNHQTYILLKPGTDVAKFEQNFERVIEKYVGPQAYQALNITMDGFRKAGNSIRFWLVPLTAIHLHSKQTVELSPNGDIQYIYTFAAVALFILLIACINFMNLSTARSAHRAREVGVRKVLGSERQQLIAQFISESVLMATLGMGLALVLVSILLPLFNTLAAKSMTLETFLSVRILPVILLLPLVVGLLAGSYPAFFLSSFKPISVLKGRMKVGLSNVSLRSGLVVFQFMMSVLLIIGTIVVYRQINFIQTKNLGFNREQIVTINDVYAIGNKAQSFKDEVAQLPGVQKGTLSGYLPTPSDRNNSTIFPHGQLDQNKAVSTQIWSVDHDYISTLGMKVIEGRDFAREFGSDSSGIILNETAVKLFGFDNPLGKQIDIITDFQEKKTKVYTVVGVIKNFHFESLRQNIGALVMILQPRPSAISFRISTHDVPTLMKQIEAKWQQFAPGQPFVYTFMEDSFDAMYRAEQRIGSIAITFASLAILIACLGLFGLAAFMAEQRTKEIGVRKVLGASIPSLISLLSKDFLKLVLIAIVIASPIAWYTMALWLRDFEYRIDLEWWMFALAGLLAIGIALLTVSFQSVKAALMNPVKSLRSE